VNFFQKNAVFFELASSFHEDQVKFLKHFKDVRDPSFFCSKIQS